MVEEDHLSILLAALDLLARGVVAWVFVVWVHADDLAVALVPEQQSLVRVGVGSEVRRVVD